MEQPSPIADLEGQVVALLRAAFSQGVAVGETKMAERIMMAAAGALPSSSSPSVPTPVAARPPLPEITPADVAEVVAERSAALDRSRAPKGAIDEVLDLALQSSPGATTQEVEQIVQMLDHRIAIKSVYNRLRHFEKNGVKYKRANGRWYAIDQAPLIGSPYVGETSGRSAAGPINGVTPQGQTAPTVWEAGGT